MRLSIVLCAVLFAVGCIGTGTADVGYSGGVSVSTPDLVEVEPGVQVVADYDESIFYTDGFYWRYDGSGWYRSNNYASGFVYIDSPPVVVTRIREPQRYTHYRPSGYVVHNRPQRRPEPIVRDHRAPAPEMRREEPRREEPRREPEVRDHREPTPPARQPEPVVRDHREQAPPARQAPPPVVRDHRDDDDKKKKHR